MTTAQQLAEQAAEKRREIAARPIEEQDFAPAEVLEHMAAMAAKLFHGDAPIERPWKPRRPPADLPRGGIDLSMPKED